MNILFSSAGRRVALIQLFRQALAQAGAPGMIVAADAQVSAPALQAADQAYIVPLIRDTAYIPALLEICQRHSIDIVIPCFDPDLVAIAGARTLFESIGTRILVSDSTVIQTCNDKLETYRFFCAHNIPTVKTVRSDEFEAADLHFPIFAKPIDGHGSINATPLSTVKELVAYRSRVPNAVFQELATGIEYTTDVLVDFDGTVISVVPRQRIEVRAGEVSKGITRKNWRLIEYAQQIAKALGASGPLCIQCFVDGDSVRYTEINPRFGGGLPLSVAAGANQPLWTIRMLNGEKLRPTIGEFEEDLLMLRYDEAFFVSESQLRSLPCSVQ